MWLSTLFSGQLQNLNWNGNMSWTDWIANLFRYKPKPDYWETLYRSEKVRADEVLSKLIQCQTDSSRVKSDLTLAIDQIKKLNASVTSLDRRNQALQGQLMVADKYAGELKTFGDEYKTLYDDLLASIGSTGKDLVSANQELGQEIERLRAELYNTQVALKQALEDLKKPVPPVDITPIWFTAYLKNKYKDVVDRSKIWDEWDSAVMFGFAVEITEDAVVIPASEFKAKLVEAFPNAVWHSALKDNQYYTCSMNQAEIIIRNDFGNLKSYAPDKWDCDKFTQKLRVHFIEVYGYTVAVEVWGNSPVGFHSWILVRCSDGVLMVEPQNDSITRIPDILPGYEVTAFHDA